VTADHPLLLVPVALDGTSERAISVALDLARGREVRLFSWSSDEGEAAAAKRYLVELAEDLHGPWSVEVACSDDREPAAAIARAAEEAEATVCMATERAGRWGQSWCGSTGLAVVQATGRAILVGPHARAPHSGDHRSLLVCVDGSRAAEQVLPLAEAWAEDQALDLRFVRVVPPATPYPIEPARGDDQPWTYLCNLSSLCGHARGRGGSVAVLYGDPAGEIVGHARHASLVAMATNAHPGIDLAVRRSTAMRVVHRSPCPVLLVKATA
jgi:nucleotide-binding universal stress UspA family protein